MDKLEELLPGLDDFLCNILSKEALTSLAEKKRQYYMERLEILRLPPSLPPRPAEGLPKLLSAEEKDILAERSKNKPKTRVPSREPRVRPQSQKGEDEDFAANQRKIARQASQTRIVLNGHNGHSNQDYEDTEFYDNLEEERTDDDLDHTDDGLYEEPTIHDDAIPNFKNYASSNDGLDHTADESSTSYESYDEEDHQNSRVLPEQPSVCEDIPLPSIKGKKKKKELKNRKSSSKDLSKESEFSARALQNVTVSGYMYLKGMLSWTRRYCAITGKMLCVYKSEKDSKPLHKIPVLGYDILYLEKEGKRSHVIRVSHPGCETLWLSADNLPTANNWLDKLVSAASIEDDSYSDKKSIEKSVSFNSFNSVYSDKENRNESQEPSPNDMTFILSDGEGGKIEMRDDVISPNSNRKKSKESSKLRVKASNFFSFGKKKGKRIAEILEIGEARLDKEEEENTDVLISGMLNVLSKMAGHTEWVERWCQIHNGLFECYVRPEDEEPEFTFQLQGCEVETAKDTGKDLAIRITYEATEKTVLEASNTLRQGNWLGKIIKVTGCGLRGNKSDLQEMYDDVYEKALSSALVAGIDGMNADELYDDVLVNPSILNAIKKLKEEEGAAHEESENNSTFADILKTYNDRVAEIKKTDTPRSKKRSLSSASNASEEDSSGNGEHMARREILEKLRDEIQDKKKELALLRRKRTIARNKRIHARKPSEKQEYDDEYKAIDMQFIELEQTIKYLEVELDKKEGKRSSASSIFQKLESSSQSSSARSSNSSRLSDKIEVGEARDMQAETQGVRSRALRQFEEKLKDASSIEAGDAGLSFGVCPQSKANDRNKFSPTGSPRLSKTKDSPTVSPNFNRQHRDTSVRQQTNVNDRNKSSPSGSPRMSKASDSSTGSPEFTRQQKDTSGRLFREKELRKTESDCVLSSRSPDLVNNKANGSASSFERLNGTSSPSWKRNAKAETSSENGDKLKQNLVADSLHKDTVGMEDNAFDNNLSYRANAKKSREDRISIDDKIKEFKKDLGFYEKKQDAKKNIMSALTRQTSMDSIRSNSSSDLSQKSDPFLTNFERMRAEQKAKRAQLKKETEEIFDKNNLVQSKLKEFQGEASFDRTRRSSGINSSSIYAARERFSGYQEPHTVSSMKRIERRYSVGRLPSYPSDLARHSVKDKLKEWEKLEKK